MSRANLFCVLLVCLISQLSLPVNAQQKHDSLVRTIQNLDSLFWVTYNNCDTVKFREFFTREVEFYHDKGGPTIGLAVFEASMKKNLCGNVNFRLRREAVPGSVKVFPMEQSGKIYGAIISGSHLFYIREDGKERLDGLARFTHLWLLSEGNWKMARILSYDHGPAPKQLATNK